MPLTIPPATRRRLMAIAVLATCAFSVAFPRAWQQSLRHTAQGAAYPLQAPLASAHDALRRVGDRVAALWGAAEELERLREENRALREALARQADEAHRTELRLRNFTQIHDFASAHLDRPFRPVPASVIAVDASPWRRSVVINRGSADGLTLGAPAVWGTSIVGTVVALRPAAATVRLLTDSRAGLTARLVRTGDVGLLHGTTERDTHLVLKWIHLHPVEKSDMVVTSGIDPNVPPGLAAGQVVTASRTREPLFFDVQVRPLIDLDRLTELLILVPSPGDVQELLEREKEADRPR